MTDDSEFTEVQTLDALIVNVQTADAIIAETLRNEVICATFSKTLKSPTFATLTQIESLERFSRRLRRKPDLTTQMIPANWSDLFRRHGA